MSRIYYAQHFDKPNTVLMVVRLLFLRLVFLFICYIHNELKFFSLILLFPVLTLQTVSGFTQLTTAHIYMNIQRSCICSWCSLKIQEPQPGQI